MNFWKKLFAGMGFVCGFLVFETMSLAYHNSSRRHKNRKGRCRRNSFWDTLTRYMIFAWIYDGVKKSREQVGRRYYRRTGNEFRPSYDSGTRSNPFEPAIPLNLQKPLRKPQMQHSPKSSGRLRLRRKRGRFKPMLPFGGKSVLAHVIETWHRAGVRHVVVVGGFKKELTGRCARACGALFAENPRPEDGMFSSVAAGLACALNAFPQAGWFGVQPVDIPLILPETISAAVRAAETSEAGYVIPVCGGFRGHPPFLSRAAAKAALTMNPERGLQSVLGELSCGEVPVNDPYINMDMDRPADYDRALAILRKREEDSARREQNRKEK